MGQSRFSKYRKRQAELYEDALSKHYDALTADDRKTVRTQLTIQQDGCCAICGRAEKEMTRQLAIDHCHITGHIRGLLCGNCNFLLGLARDNLYILRDAVSYLEKSQEKIYI